MSGDTLAAGMQTQQAGHGYHQSLCLTSSIREERDVVPTIAFESTVAYKDGSLYLHLLTYTFSFQLVRCHLALTFMIHPVLHISSPNIKTTNTKSIEIDKPRD